MHWNDREGCRDGWVGECGNLPHGCISHCIGCQSCQKARIGLYLLISKKLFCFAEKNIWCNDVMMISEMDDVYVLDYEAIGPGRPWCVSIVQTKWIIIDNFIVSIDPPLYYTLCSTPGQAVLTHISTESKMIFLWIDFIHFWLKNEAFCSPHRCCYCLNLYLLSLFKIK